MEVTILYATRIPADPLTRSGTVCSATKFSRRHAVAPAHRGTPPKTIGMNGKRNANEKDNGKKGEWSRDKGIRDEG